MNAPRPQEPRTKTERNAGFETDDSMSGAILAERYRILERIGTGAMGTVYRAEQIGLRRQVALKVLKRELVTHPETVARFDREAKAMSMLLHPNTVRVFDFGRDPRSEHMFLVMELLEGELLTTRLERGGPVPIGEALHIVFGILRSLSEAHRKGLIHRDLKPDNVYLARIEGDSDPVVKILDFGIAKVFRDEEKIDQLETQAGTVFGTPRYMSPEQAQGKPLDPRSDLYSVGVLLYQLLSGCVPFKDEDAVVVMARHIRERPVPISRAAPDRNISPELEAVVFRAMEKHPQDRFDSAEALESALKAAFQASSEQTVSEAAALEPKVRSARAAWLTLGLATLLLSALATAAFLSGRVRSIPHTPGVHTTRMDSPVIRSNEADVRPTDQRRALEGARPALFLPSMIDAPPALENVSAPISAERQPSTKREHRALRRHVQAVESTLDVHPDRSVDTEPPVLAHPAAPSVATPAVEPYERFD